MVSVNFRSAYMTFCALNLMTGAAAPSYYLLPISYILDKPEGSCDAKEFVCLQMVASPIKCTVGRCFYTQIRLQLRNGGRNKSRSTAVGSASHQSVGTNLRNVPRCRRPDDERCVDTPSAACGQGHS